MESVFSFQFWNLGRITGVLLILAFLIPILLIGIFTITGNLPKVFSQIQGSGHDSFVRNISLVGWIIASLVSLAGLTLLSFILTKERDFPLSKLAWIAMVLATVFLILEATIHLSFGSWAAEEFLRTGKEPDLYREIFRWASVILQRVYVPIGYFSLILYGCAVLQSDILPDWSGWQSIVWGGGMLLVLIFSGVTLPATLLIPGTVIGIFLLVLS